MQLLCRNQMNPERKRLAVTLPRPGVPFLTIAILFLATFFVYECSLAVYSSQPYPDFWYFNADSFRLSFTKTGRHPVANYQTVKHPLFVAVGVPLHRIGRTLFSRLSAPYSENAALSFPVAVLGALNACLALLTFTALGFRRSAALFPTVLYAGASSVWIFSTFPDSYIGTTVFTNIFIYCFVNDPKLTRTTGLAFVNALAAFSSPQQALLAIMPIVRLIRVHRCQSWRSVMRYGALFAMFFVLPYSVFLIAMGRVSTPKSEFSHWASLANLADPKVWAAVGSMFLAASEVIPRIPPAAFDPVFVAVRAAVFPLVISGAAIVLYAVTGRYRAGDVAPSGRLEVGLFLLAYLLFFVVWSPGQAFLFSAPFVLPFWLLLHQGHVDHQDARLWRAVIIAACVLVIANNTAFISQLYLLSPTYERVR